MSSKTSLCKRLICRNKLICKCPKTSAKLQSECPHLLRNAWFRADKHDSNTKARFFCLPSMTSRTASLFLLAFPQHFLCATIMEFYAPQAFQWVDFISIDSKHLQGRSLFLLSLLYKLCALLVLTWIKCGGGKIDGEKLKKIVANFTFWT